MKRSPNRSVATRLRALLLTVGLVLAGVVGVAGPASAFGTNDYAWSGATAVPGGSSEWGYTSCPANDTGCMTISGYGTDGKKYGMSDPWGYYIRNCTSWDAFKLSQQGFNASGMGNAANWGLSSKATNHVDDTPAPGAVAWWGANKLDDGYSVGTLGHVAYVNSVNTDGSVNIEEYNHLVNGVPDGLYHTRTISASSTQQVQYIHLADTSGGGVAAGRGGIKNGGFNDSTSYWVRTGTANFTTYGPSGVYEGDGYGATNAAAAGDSIRQDVVLNSTAGDSYCVSARVRTDGSGSGAAGSLAIYALGSTATEGSSKPFSGLTNDWTPVESCVTATSSHTSIRVQIYPTVGAPTLAVDAVDMHESLLNTAGFNGSSSGWGRTGTANFALYSSGSYEGTGYGATNAPAAGDSIYQNVTRTINAGDTYCVDARVKSNTAGATSNGTLAIWLLGSTANENSTYRFTSLGNDWTPIKTCVTAGGAHTSIRVQFYPDQNTPTIGMDAVALYPTLARNGGFNDGTAYWIRTGTANIAPYTSGQYEGGGYVATNASAGGDSIRPSQDSARTIDAGDMYCVSAMVRSNVSGSTTSGSLALWMLGTSATENSTIQFSGIGNDWTPIKTCVTASGDHTSLRIQLYPAVGAPTIGVDAVDMG